MGGNGSIHSKKDPNVTDTPPQGARVVSEKGRVTRFGEDEDRETEVVADAHDTTKTDKDKP
jgi:hypothetical protein